MCNLHYAIHEALAEGTNSRREMPQQQTTINFAGDANDALPCPIASSLARETSQREQNLQYAMKCAKREGDVNAYEVPTLLDPRFEMCAMQI